MFPVGTIIPYAGNLSKIPYGWHVCDGTNGTPDLSDRFLEGTTTTPKTFKDAGLPNIEGALNGDSGNPTSVSTEPFSFADTWSYSGALSPGEITSLYFDSDLFNTNGHYNSTGTWGFSFDASQSNTIYGASETVQPKSYTVYYIMRVK